MVNFRFHLVSLTAVFMAIAIGIAVGATVVDRATVDALKRSHENVSRRVNQTNSENAALRRDLSTWGRFAEEAEAEAVAARLAEVPVLVIGVRGVDRAPVDELRQTLAAADARMQGMVWFTSRLKLEKADDVNALGAILGLRTRSADALRQSAVARVVAALSGGEPPGVLVALRDAAFIEYEAPDGGTMALDGVPLPGTLFVVVSAPQPDVPNEQLATPLAAQLARTAGARVLAVEPSRGPTPGDPGQRAVFLAALRQDASTAAVLSTVDNIEDFRGRFAAVYALRDLLRGKVGHFGVGPGASRAVPQSAS